MMGWRRSNCLSQERLALWLAEAEAGWRAGLLKRKTGEWPEKRFSQDADSRTYSTAFNLANEWPEEDLPPMRMIGEPAQLLGSSEPFYPPFLPHHWERIVSDALWYWAKEEQ